MILKRFKFVYFNITMIILKITNASDVVASKAGKLFEKITPDQIDQKLVESQVIQQMIDQLQLEGLKGQISIVKGLDISKDSLIMKNNFKIKSTKTF